jgi:hypothetical protein
MGSVWFALVIDDDPGIRQSLRLCLEADGARGFGVGTPSRALEALDRGPAPHPPRAVVLRADDLFAPDVPQSHWPRALWVLNQGFVPDRPAT